MHDDEMHRAPSSYTPNSFGKLPLAFPKQRRFSMPIHDSGNISSLSVLKMLAEDKVIGKEAMDESG
jgi:hypothetical protein